MAKTLSAVERRLVARARFAQHFGADIIVEACSCVGSVIDSTRTAADLPVVGLDRAAAKKAVQLGKLIGVTATQPTMPQPTTRLIHHPARQPAKRVQMYPLTRFQSMLVR